MLTHCKIFYFQKRQKIIILFENCANDYADTSQNSRVVKSLFGFCVNRSFFVNKIAICSFPRANRSRRSLKKSNGAKSDGSNLLVGIRMGNAVKNCQKHDKNNEYFHANCFYLESEREKV